MGSEISPTNDLTLSLFHCVKLSKRQCLILLLGVSNQTLLMPKSKDSRYLLRVWKHALKTQAGQEETMLDQQLIFNDGPKKIRTFGRSAYPRFIYDSVTITCPFVA